jgi:hypothetical protein
MKDLQLEEKSIKMEFENSKLNSLIDEIKHSPEIKSEHDKEDYIGLENIFCQKNSFDEYMDTNDPGSNVVAVAAINPKIIASKSLLSTKDQNKLKNTRTRCGSDFRSPSDEHKDENEEFPKNSNGEYSLLCSPKSLTNKHAIVEHEKLSLKSEEKCVSKVPKTNHMTNPTSDSCSIKCSSVTSDPDNKVHKENVSESQNKTSNYQNNEWITSTNKKTRHAKNKGGNKAKQANKRKTKNGAKQSKK